MKMIILSDEFYAELAQELAVQICDGGNSDGVVELKVPSVEGPSADIVFAFNSADFTLQNGLSSLNYLLLAFHGGLRCSTDFEVKKLELQIDA